MSVQEIEIFAILYFLLSKSLSIFISSTLYLCILFNDIVRKKKQESVKFSIKTISSNYDINFANKTKIDIYTSNQKWLISILASFFFKFYTPMTRFLDKWK